MQAGSAAARAATILSRETLTAGGIVAQVNGLPVRGLRDVKQGLASRAAGFHVIRFAGVDDALVLDARTADAADREIADRYGVPSPEYFGDKP